MPDHKKRESDSLDVSAEEIAKEVLEQRKRAKQKRTQAEKEIEDGARPREDRFRL